MSYLIREVTPQEFVQYFGEPSRDRLARLVLAPVNFPRAFYFAFHEGDSKPVARIGVSLSVPLDDGKLGAAVGFFSGDTQALRDFFQHVQIWCSARGVSKMFGPMIYNTWFPYRAKIYDAGLVGQLGDSDQLNQVGSGQDFSWEPHQPRGDERAWLENGFQTAETYATRALDGLSEFTQRQLPALEEAKRLGFSAHSFSDLMTSSETRTGLLNDLFDLTMDSFKDAYLFLPIPREHFHQLYVAGLTEIKDLSMSYLLRSSDGRPAAFSFAFQEGKFLVIKTLAVGKDFRGKKLSNAAMAHSCLKAQELGLDKMIHALMRRGNISENFGGKSKLLWEHTYALFAKTL